MSRPWLNPPSGGTMALAARLDGLVPELVATRLHLSAPQPSDFVAYAQIAMTERGRYFGGPMDEQAAWLDFCQMSAGWVLRGYGLWTVRARLETKILGFVLINHEWGDAEPELGFMFLAEAEGKGLAIEAARAARTYAWKTLRLPTLVSYIDPANTRAASLARRLGATLESQTADCLTFRHSRPETKQ